MAIKQCKNPQCRIFFQAPDRSGPGRPPEYCYECSIIKAREAMCRARKKYKDTHPNEKIGNSRDDAKILRFLREKRAKEDKKYLKG